MSQHSFIEVLTEGTHYYDLEMNPLLFILSILNLSEKVEGTGCQLMTPELESKAFPANTARYKSVNGHKEPHETSLETYKRTITVKYSAFCQGAEYCKPIPGR